MVARIISVESVKEIESGSTVRRLSRVMIDAGSERGVFQGMDLNVVRHSSLWTGTVVQVYKSSAVVEGTEYLLPQRPGDESLGRSVTTLWSFADDAD